MSSNSVKVFTPKDLSMDAKAEPEGGEPGTTVSRRLNAWLLMIGGWLILFTTFGYASAFGVYLDFLVSVHTSSASNISWMGSSMLFFLSALSLPAGALLDKGHFRATVLAGSTIFIISLFMASLAHPNSYYQLYLSLGAGLGIGIGTCYVPTVAIQARFWKENRAFAMGFVVSGSSVGGIVWPIMLNRLLFVEKTGFGSTVRATAYLSLALLALGNLFIMLALRTGAPPSPIASDPPAIKSFFTDMPYMFTLVAYILIFWELFFPNFYIQLFAAEHGADPNIVFYTVPILNAASILGRILLNVLADRIGAFNASILASLSSVILILSMLKISTVAGIIIFAVMYGFFAGGVISLLPPTVSSLAKHPSEIGLRVGISYFIGAFCNVTGTPIAGALLGSHFKWYKPIIFSATTMFAGVILIVCGRFMVAKNRGTPWV
ncbi:MFS general substrate transporter [Mycena floridula]|nr:MFS general substrate transporter [Mycena floridula]